MSVVNKKLRLSNEKATKETLSYLEQKRATEKESTETLPLIRTTVLNDLFAGIHVLTQQVADTDYLGIIRNNYIESLAAEFPDLVL